VTRALANVLVARHAEQHAAMELPVLALRAAEIPCLSLAQPVGRHGDSPSVVAPAVGRDAAPSPAFSARKSAWAAVVESWPPMQADSAVEHLAPGSRA